MLVVFVVLTVAASTLVLVRGRAAGGGFAWPTSLSKIFGSRTASKNVAISPLSPPAPAPPITQLLFWRTDGTSGTWTGTNWSNPASATGGTAWTSGVDAQFSANSTVTFASTGVGNLTLDNGTTVTVTQAGTLSTGSHIFTIGTGSTLTWTGQAVSANSASSFDKEGPGTWNIGSQANNYTGGFTLGAGTVIVTGAKSFGTAGLNLNGGSLQSSGGITFAPTSVTVGGNFEFAGTGNDVWNQTWNLGASNRTITNSTTSTATRTFANVISGGSGAGLILAGTGGTGGIVFSAANNYSGNTTISAGKLSLTGSGSIASPIISIAGGATFDVAGVTTPPYSLTNSQTLNGTNTGATPGTINGSLTMGSTSPLTLNYATGNPTLTVTNGTLTLQSGETVTVTNDGAALAPGDYRLISKGTAGLVSGTPGTVIVNGTGGMVPGAGANLVNTGNELFLHVSSMLNVTSDPTANEGNAGTTTETFTVTLTPASTGTVTVHYSTQDNTATTADSDYVGISDSVLTFTAGETTKNINVTINGDTKFEPTEQFFFNISTPSGANISDNQGIGTITNDDSTPILNVTNDPSVTEGNAGTTPAAFNVTLSNPTYQTVTVHYSTQDSSATVADNDYTAILDTTLTFNPGEVSKNIDVLVKGDINVEPNEQFFFTIVNPLNANISDNQGIGTITNDDVADTDVSLTGGNLVLTDGNGGATADTLTISLNGSNVRINDPSHTVGCSGGTQVDANTCDVPLSSITGNIQVNTLGGNDTLTLNFAGGNFLPPGGLSYDGGSQTSTPGDRLNITGGSQGTVTYNYTNAHDGSVVMSNYGTVNYVGLEPISNSGTAIDIVFNLPPGPNAATLADDGTSNTLSRLSAATIETTDFANPTGSLTINRGNASDTLVVNALPDFNASLTIGSGANPFSTITFSGAVTLAANQNLSGDAASTISLSSTSADLAASGTGTVTLTTARDITFSAGASIGVVNGDMTLSANQQVSPTSGDFRGIRISGASLTTTGTGKISLKGKGGDTGGAPNHFGIQITAGATVSSTSAAAGAGTITFEGNGGPGSQNNRGVEVSNSGTTVSSVTGDIKFIGLGGSGGPTNYGVSLLNGPVVSSTGAAKITLDGTGGGGTLSSVGSRVSGQGTQLTSAGGDILIKGKGGTGTGGSHHGVSVAFGALVSATGGAKITCDGTGGAGDSSAGVVVSAVLPIVPATNVTSDSGEIKITGVGGTGTGGGLIGVNINASATVVATGSANITINGTSGAGSGDDCYGVDFESAGQTGTAVTSVNGNISVTGTSLVATDLRQNGIRFEDSAPSSAIAFTMATTGTGAITLTGTAGNHDQSSAGIRFTDDAAVSSTGASNSFIADTMDIGNSNVSINVGANTLTLRPKTAGTLIDLGSATDIAANTLELSDVELDRITCGTLNIGDANSGAITITAPITRAAATALNLTSNGAINLNASALDSGGGNVKLSPGSSAAVDPKASGTDVNMGTTTPGTLSFLSGSDLSIAITGTTVDTQYRQLNVVGKIDLTGVDLALSGSPTLIGGEQFVIVNNDDTDAISGTFNGLAEGATLTNFLGSGFNATITYAGGSNLNDVVIKVAAGCPTSFTVTDSTDDADATPGDGVCATANATCSLRAAIQESNLLGSCAALTIDFDVSGGPRYITLQNALPPLTHSVTILGPTTESVTIDGSFAYRVFEISSAPVVNISNLNIFNGRDAAGSGAGLWHGGTGTVTVTNSTFSGNEAGAGGGGAANTGGGILSLTNSTFQSNTTFGFGGAILNSAGIANLLNVTVAENSAIDVGSPPHGGGVAHTGGTVNVKNTIIANNLTEGAGPDIFGSFVSQGHNLIGDGTDGTGFVNGTNGDQVGDTNAPINPRLNQLNFYGGSTQTMELLPGSPALEAGDNTGAPAADQRGVTRPQGNTVDIGAFELRAYFVTKTADTGGTCLPGNCSLREAIDAVNGQPNAGMILFKIPAGDGGCDADAVCTIAPPTDALPQVRRPTFIDGYSQAGSKPNGLDLDAGDDAVLKIRLSGAGLSAGSIGIDLHYGADWSVVRGLIINSFGGSGIWIENDGDSQVSGNFIGTDAAGTAAAANGDGVKIVYGFYHLIGGDLPAERNIISGNSTDGIRITGDETGFNLVEGNYIGTRKNGDNKLPNTVGVLIEERSGDNTVGCEVINGDNLISGNTEAGVRIKRSSDNYIQGNLIGTDKTGTVKIPNDVGVDLQSASFNQIGLPDFGNLISGNINAGLQITTLPEERPSFANNVEGNRIGTNFDGTAALPNNIGILLSRVLGTTIGGGNVPADRNYISGNLLEGIRVETTGYPASSAGNQIFGNSIGTNVAGDAAIGNQGAGVKIVGGTQNEVGCTFPGSGNLISGNLLEGVELTGGAVSNFVQGNLIGLKADGSSDLGNGGSGVEVYVGSTDNVIGVLDLGGPIDELKSQPGSAPAKLAPCRQPAQQKSREARADSHRETRAKAEAGLAKSEKAEKPAATVGHIRRISPRRKAAGDRFSSRLNNMAAAKQSTGTGPTVTPSPSPTPLPTAFGGNVIAFNHEDGVKITTSGDVNNLISQNSIFSNVKLGINLVGASDPASGPQEGVTDNDTGDGDSGPNNLQNFPEITDAAVDTQTIYGVLDSPSGTAPFTIEFFVNDSCDPSGNGEGKTFIGSMQTSSGPFKFTAPPNSFTPGQAITATATDGDFNTSEFSACFLASPTTLGADLYIEKTDSPDPVAINNTLTYTITVFSNGPADAHKVEVIDTLPGAVTFVSATPSQGSCSGTTTVTCNLGTVSFGQTPTVQIVVTAPGTPGSITNSASVSSPDDTVNENNTDNEATLVQGCPSIFTVNSNGDADDANPGDKVCATAGAVCTLRAAIEEANALPSCGTIDINFSGVTGAINLGTALPSIDHNVNINGPGASVLTVQRSGATAFRIFTVSPGRTVSINDLTIANGSASIGGGIYNNRGTLAVRYCTVSGNSASSFGGGIHNGGIGAGTADLTILNSTISDNSSAGDGGGVYSDAGSGTAALTIINSTVSSNTANNHVGGVYVISSTATLTNVTITNNRADNDSASGGAAGGLSESTGTVTLHNTIVAGNFRGGSPSTTADDINGAMQSGSSYNLIGDGTGMSGLTNGTNNNQVGSAGSPINALLGALQDNGGPTFTHGLLYNSPAVDKGDDAVLGPPLQLGTDQRGLPRQADGDLTAGAVVDIGAYERQATESRIVPNGSDVKVNLVDTILTFPCVPGGNCVGARTRKDGASTPALSPSVTSPTASLKVLDPAAQPAPPPGYLVGNSTNPPLPAFDLSTTVSFDPPIEVCFYLPSITNATFFSSLRILHSNGTSLDPLTTSHDFSQKTICANSNSLSPFVIAQFITPTAANGSVSGQILDTSGHPVEGAGVRMSGTQNRFSVTDANGNYRFDEVETNGFYTVVPSRPNYIFNPAQRSFSALGQQTQAAFTAAANSTSFNPLDTTEYFVRQQYLDFLGREPDEAGLNFWYRHIEGCGDDAGCRAARRIDTSAAFFLSIEFQQTGYLVYRTYQAAYGDLPNAPVPLRLNEFRPDTSAISNGVIVNKTGWETQLDHNKENFMAEFVRRPRFVAAYPLTMTPAEFVDRLFATAGVSPAVEARMLVLGEFGSNSTSSDPAARGRALRRVAENPVLSRQEFNQAFVLMQYFGYLRRDANAGQDTDFSGFDFWLEKLKTFQGNFGDAEMVKAFLLSSEYRGRFPR